MDEKELELYRFMKVALESGATIKMTEKGKGGLFVRGRKITDKDLLECITDPKPISCSFCGGTLSEIRYYNGQPYRHCYGCHFDRNTEGDQLY